MRVNSAAAFARPMAIAQLVIESTKLFQILPMIFTVAVLLFLGNSSNTKDSVFHILCVTKTQHKHQPRFGNKLV